MTHGQIAFMAYTGPLAPMYGPNDPASAWLRLTDIERQRWERIARAVLDAAEPRPE